MGAKESQNLFSACQHHYHDLRPSVHYLKRHNLFSLAMELTSLVQTLGVSRCLLAHYKNSHKDIKQRKFCRTCAARDRSITGSGRADYKLEYLGALFMRWYRSQLLTFCEMYKMGLHQPSRLMNSVLNISLFRRKVLQSRGVEGFIEKSYDISAFITAFNGCKSHQITWLYQRWGTRANIGVTMRIVLAKNTLNLVAAISLFFSDANAQLEGSKSVDEYTFWDQAPDFSNDPMQPFPSLKDSDGQNITIDNLRGVRLFGYKGCTNQEGNAINVAYNDFYKLAQQPELYNHINWNDQVLSLLATLYHNLRSPACI